MEATHETPAWGLQHYSLFCSADAIFNGYDMKGMKDCQKIESPLFQLVDATACKWSYKTEYDLI